nr:hypothetical protein [Tanacetum cinerariifolium]
GESDEEETRQEEEGSFDPIPRTHEGSEEESNDEEDQELRLSEEERIQEEEEADELYRDVNINHDVGVESIFTTAYSPIVSLQTPTPIMTPSTIATITTSTFRFDERLRSLETSLSEYRQTNPFVDAVSAIPDEQRNLYKVLVEAYDADKAILDTYGDSTILKRRREDDDQEGPFAGSNRGPKRQKEGEEPVQTTCQMEEPPHLMFETGADDQPILNVDTLTPDLLAGPTYELMRGSCTSLTELEYHLEEVYKATTDQLDWVNPEGQQYPHNLLQPLPLIQNNRGRLVIPLIISSTTTSSIYGEVLQAFYGYAVNRESALDVYSKRMIIAVTELKIVEWYDYKHLDWISVRRDDNQIYKFKEGNLKRLRLQDIEDMLLLLVPGKLSNLTVEERFAFNVSLRMFTRSIVIQRRVEDLQLGVESYQKRLNLTKPDTYRPDLKRREAYRAHSNPRGFIYQNKDNKNRLMRIDELHKFSDGTLNDVCNALDDRLKGIQMQYLSTTIRRRGDKDRAVAMIQAIEKMLKTKRILRSLEKFVGG